MTSWLPGSVRTSLHPRQSKTPDAHGHLSFLTFRFSDYPTLGWTAVLFDRVCLWVTEPVCVQSSVCVCVCVCVSVRACLTPSSANTMLRVVMYISCFVGPRRTSSFSSHQTFILQKRIYISRDPAQPNLLGASTSPSPSRYHSRRMFHVLVCLFSSRPSPPPPNTPTFLF